MSTKIKLSFAILFKSILENRVPQEICIPRSTQFIHFTNKYFSKLSIMVRSYKVFNFNVLFDHFDRFAHFNHFTHFVYFSCFRHFELFVHFTRPLCFYTYAICVTFL